MTFEYLSSRPYPRVFVCVHKKGFERRVTVSAEYVGFRANALMRYLRKCMKISRETGTDGEPGSPMNQAEQRRRRDSSLRSE